MHWTADEWITGTVLAVCLLGVWAEVSSHKHKERMKADPAYAASYERDKRIEAMRDKEYWDNFCLGKGCPPIFDLDLCVGRGCDKR